MAELAKIRLLVPPPAGNPVQQLRMSYDELRRRSRRRTMVEPVGPCLFRICEPSLVCGFSYRDIIEAVPRTDEVWHFSRLSVKSPYHQIFLSPELLCSVLYLEGRSTYRLIRTIYDAFRHGCAIRHFDDWIIIGCPPDLPFDPMERIRPPIRRPENACLVRPGEASGTDSQVGGDLMAGLRSSGCQDLRPGMTRRRAR